MQISYSEHPKSVTWLPTGSSSMPAIALRRRRAPSLNNAGASSSLGSACAGWKRLVKFSITVPNQVRILKTTLTLGSKSLAMFPSKNCKHRMTYYFWNPPVVYLHRRPSKPLEGWSMQPCSWAGTVTLPSSNFEGVAVCWGSSSSSDSCKTTTRGSCTCNLPSDNSTHLADGKWGKTATSADLPLSSSPRCLEPKISSSCSSWSSESYGKDRVSIVLTDCCKISCRKQTWQWKSNKFQEQLTRHIYIYRSTVSIHIGIVDSKGAWIQNVDRLTLIHTSQAVWPLWTIRKLTATIAKRNRLVQKYAKAILL